MKKVSEMLATYQKAYGATVGSMGGADRDIERVPSGVFALDLAMGGGFPRGKTSIVYGPESSSKTNLALRTIVMHQTLYPNLLCVFVDVEHGFDQKWAAGMGVDTDRLVVLQPDYAEQAGDMIEGMLAAEDCGLIVLDSVAAMDSAKMNEKSLEDAMMGGIGVLMSRLCGKIITQMRLAEKSGRPCPTMMFLNQIRTKVGIAYGSPYKMPGGDKQKFTSSMIVRVTGKNIMDPKISKVLPVAKETNFILEKWKVPVCAINGTFQMTMVANSGLNIGDCSDFNTVASVLKTVGMLVKHETAGWLLRGHHYPTLQAAKDRFYADRPYALEIKGELIAKAIAEGSVAAQNDDDE